MQLGMIGLGRMGANIVRRLMRDGHECVVWDVSADAIATLVAEGATGAATLEEFTAKLVTPRGAGVMIIDGGNSNSRDDIHRADALREKGIHYIDIGTSGGVFGLERGFCLMVG